MRTSSLLQAKTHFERLKEAMGLQPKGRPASPPLTMFDRIRVVLGMRPQSLTPEQLQQHAYRIVTGATNIPSIPQSSA
jgi:hypothetical protein